MSARSVVSVGSLLLLSSAAFGQLPTFSESKVEVYQTFPPVTDPLLSIYGSASSQSGVSIESKPLTGSVTFAPGATYRLIINCFSQGYTDHAGTGGAIADVHCRVDFGSVTPMILPSSNGTVTGCLTEMGGGGHHECFQPTIGRDFSMNVPFKASSFGFLDDLVFGVGLAFGSSDSSARLVQNSLAISDRVVASASYSMPVSAGLWSTSSAVLRIDFQLPQAATATIGGKMNSGLAGSSQQSPMTPPSGIQFLDAPSSLWFASPLAQGYDFQQTGTSLFSEVMELPVGVARGGQFNVFVGGQYLGQFAEGGRVDFVQLVGGGVPAFRIVGIGPMSYTPERAFPVRLAFDTPYADFTMKPLHWGAPR